MKQKSYSSDMTDMQMLALLIIMVNSIAIVYHVRRIRYRTYLRPKKPKAEPFWAPMRYPEDGEDAEFCDICHGRLGDMKMAVCACGKKFHRECVRDQECPNCGNDIAHMFGPKPSVMLCPMCIRRAPGGYCKHCNVVFPRREGTFRCVKCGAKVLASHPECRKCGKIYRPRLAKGYMSRVRSR